MALNGLFLCWCAIKMMKEQFRFIKNLLSLSLPVSEMRYNVSSGTLNPTIACKPASYHTVKRRERETSSSQSGAIQSPVSATGLLSSSWPKNCRYLVYLWPQHRVYVEYHREWWHKRPRISRVAPVISRSTAAVIYHQQAILLSDSTVLVKSVMEINGRLRKM